MITTLKTIWMHIRRLSGDDAYECYLLHFAEHAQHQPLQLHQPLQPQPTLLSRQEFFKQWQDGQWKGIKRCC